MDASRKKLIDFKYMVVIITTSQDQSSMAPAKALFYSTYPLLVGHGQELHT